MSNRPGRKPDSGIYTKQLNASVQPEIYEKVKAIADKKHAAMSTVARNLIIKALEQGDLPEFA